MTFDCIYFQGFLQKFKFYPESSLETPFGNPGSISPLFSIYFLKIILLKSGGIGRGTPKGISKDISEGTAREIPKRILPQGLFQLPLMKFL